MFGQTTGFGTGGGFGQQQQQQPAQQTGGLFGQTTTAFGQPQQQQQTGGLFGQPQQPAQTGGLFGQPAQQPQQSTGLFGAPAAGATGGFGSTGGAFGAGSTGTFGQQQQARPAFGATGASTGLFGSNTGGSTFGSTPAFGATNTANAGTSTGGLFGNTSTAFGAKPATTGFGAAPAATTGGMFGAKPAGTGLFGAAPTAGAGPVTNGTAGTAFQPVREKDGNTNNHSVYQTITIMDAYKGNSLEELRLQDYQQGRKTAPPPGTNAFGVGSSTGGLFGQPTQQQNGTGLFGQQPAQPAATGFGASGSTGLFGQQQPATGTTAFGQPAQQSTGFGAASTGTGLFGSNTQSTGLFGQAPQAQQTGGLFGQQPQQQGQTGLFGQQPAGGTTGGGLFGSNTASTTTGGGLFGQNNTTQPAASTGFSFGAANNNSTQAKPAFGTGFGAAPTTTFGQPAAGATSTGFGFGNTQQQGQQAQQPSTGFGFGAQPASTTQTGGLFGNNTQQQPAQSGGLFGAKPAGGLFGSTPAATNTFGTNTQQPATGGLFGNTQAAQPAGQQPAGVLFGSTNNTFGAQKPGGLFGSTNQTGSTTGGLFGAPAAQNNGFNQTAGQTTGGFGAGAQTGGGLFGNLGNSQQGQQNQVGQTGGLFGAKPAGTGTGLFGQNNAGNTLGSSAGGSGLFGNNLGNSQQQNLGGSLFGNSSTNQLQQSQSQAPVNIDINNPYGTGGMFSVPPSFQPINVSTGPKALPPLSSSLRPSATPSKMTPRFRGISTPARAASTLPQGSILGVSTASNGSPRNLFNTPTAETLSPAAFTPRQGVKKLVLPKKTDSNALSAVVANRTPQLSRSILHIDAEHDGSSLNGSVATGMNGKTAANSRQVSIARAPDTSANAEREEDSSISRKIDLDDYQEGEYYTIPEVSELWNCSDAQLKEMDDFVVGRKGFGELRFLEPVDIGSKANIDRIGGTLVRFAGVTCEVYPNAEDNRPPGEGLNHPAEITIEKAWPTDKEKREPIKDPKHPKQRIRERMLKNIPDTTFVSYDPVAGVWIFQVEHFTLYGIPEEADELEEEEYELNYNGKRARSADVFTHDIEDHSDESSDRDGSPSEVEESATAFAAETPERTVVETMPAIVDVQAKTKELIFDRMYGTPREKTTTPPKAKRRLQFFRKAEKEHDGEVDDLSVDRSFFGVAPTAPSNDETWRMKKVMMKDSVISGEEGAFIDLGLAMGRSFRAYVGGACQTVVPSGRMIQVSKGTQYGEKIIKRDDDLRLLEFQLDQTSFDSDSDSGVPVAETRTTTKFSDFAELYLGQNDHEAELWRLARALFDDFPVLANEVVEGEIHVDADSLVRKTAFSDWLTNHLAATIDREVSNKDVGPRAVFTLLSGNQVIRATNLALDSGDLRLASLVAQAGSGPDFRHLLQQQLDTWAQQHVDDHIDVTYRKIYALLAGIVREIEDEPSSSQLCITEGLSWLQALGLHLWYGTPLEQPLTDVISDYQAHLQSSRPPSSPVFAQGDVEDAMYGLLKVFAAQATPIEALLDPGAFGRASIDYRIQWHLLNMLINVLGIGADEAHILESVRTFDRLSVNYATQLEAAGLWQYAILILLHLDKECSRAKAVKDVLGRHAHDLDSQGHLLQKMSLPKEWIAEAKADLYRSQGEIYQEFLACKDACLWNRAHRIFMQDLASEVILRDDMPLLRKLLAGLEPTETADWNKGGQILLSYTDVHELVGQLLKASASDVENSPEMSAAVQRIPSLLQSLETVFGRSKETTDMQQFICQVHMMAKVQKLASALASQNLMPNLVPSRLLPEGDRLQVMQSASRDRLQRRLQALGS